MGSYRLTVAYDGTPFAGWASQPGQRTVQDELEAALRRILGQPVRLTVAGRTDAGVHASGQVASFDLDPPLPPGLAGRVNSLLPREVAVIEAIEAPDGFDARRDARSRTYRYRVHASSVQHPLEVGRALWWPHPLDRGQLERCAALVVGKHDFTAFTPTETEHVRFERRVMRAEWRPDPAAGRLPGRMLELWIEADAFMRHMVRVLVGTMLEVARGRREVDDFEALLRGAPRERAGDTAPAHGLCLESVLY
ncbi:MAG: tRNA pseudouridine(38-40) synthase TruA [Solirubrobacterales bacterium]